jgi:hypothetical protein
LIYIEKAGKPVRYLIHRKELLHLTIKTGAVTRFATQYHFLKRIQATATEYDKVKFTAIGKINDDWSRVTVFDDKFMGDLELLESLLNRHKSLLAIDMEIITACIVDNI